MSRLSIRTAEDRLFDYRIPAVDALRDYRRVARRSTPFAIDFNIFMAGRIRAIAEENAALMSWADDGGRSP